ncbi:MAG: ComEC/Rec2 family competence protein [Clostridia bacterium]|nr:ComEC/Rec2 family competence protein [Clostridia bacterium]
MKILEGRRMAAVFAAYIGIFSAYVLLPDIRRYVFIIGISVFILFAVNLFLRTRGQKFSVRKAAVLVLMAVAVMASYVRGIQYAEKTDVTAQYYADGEIHRAEGCITKVLYEEIYGSSYTVRLILLDETATDIGLILTLPQHGMLAVGDIVRFDGKMSGLTDTYENYQKADGIFLAAEAETAEAIGSIDEKEPLLFEKIRLFLRNHFEKNLKKETAGFAIALMTGNREHLSSDFRLAYTRLGVSHVLAVSGLHLTIIVGGLNLILRLCWIPKKYRSFLLIGSAFFFAGICGFSASVVRAAVMMSLYYLSDMFGERHDSSTALFFAIFLIVFFQPDSVYDVSMWLSFLATLGILSILPVLSVFNVSHRSKYYIPRKIAYYFISLLGMSLAATFFTLPVVWTSFGGISLIAPLANLIFVPLTQIILYLLMFLTLFAWFPWLSLRIGELIDLIAKDSETLANKLSDIDGIYMSLRYPFVPALLVSLAIGILAVMLIRKIRPAWIFAVFTLFMISFGICYGNYTGMTQDISFAYLETDGKSDTVGFVSRGKTMIVDLSTGGDFLYRKIPERLGDFYESEIDVFVLTHYHRYHAGSLRKMISNVKIHKILLPKPQTDKEQEYFEQIYSIIKEYADIEIYETDGTHIETMGEITLYLPETAYLKRSTHPLIAFSADIGDDEKGFSYLGSGVTETDFSNDVRSVTVLGVHGPVMKNIFDSTPMEQAELVIVSEKSIANWITTERISEKTVYAEDYGGYIKIMFE